MNPLRPFRARFDSSLSSTLLRTFRCGDSKSGLIILCDNSSKLKLYWVDHNIDLYCELISPQKVRLLDVHEDFVIAVAASLLLLWDIRTKELLLQVDTQTIVNQGIMCLKIVSISSSSCVCCLGCKDGETVVVDLESGKQLRCLQAVEGDKSDIWSLAYINISDTIILLTGSFQGYVTAYDLISGKLVRQIKVQGSLIYNLQIFDGTQHSMNPICITCSNDMTIRIVDLTSYEVIAVLRGHTSTVSHMCVHDFYDGAMGPLLLSCSWDKTVRLWSLKTFCCLRILTHSSQLNSCGMIMSRRSSTRQSEEEQCDLTMCPSGTATHPMQYYPTIFVCLDDKSILQWNCGSCDILREERVPGNVFMTKYLHFGNSCAAVLTGHGPITSDQTKASPIRFVDFLTGNVLQRRFVGHTSGAWAISVVAERGIACTSCFGQPFVVCWKINDSDDTGFHLEPESNKMTFFWSVAIHKFDFETSLLVIAGSNDGRVLVWDYDQRLLLADISVASKAVRALGTLRIRIRKQYQNLIYCGSRDGTVAILSENTFSVIISFNNFDEGVDSMVDLKLSSVALTPAIACGGLSGSIRFYIWSDVDDIKSIRNEPDYTLSYTAGVKCMKEVIINGGQSYLVSGHIDGMILVWNIAARAVIKKLAGHSNMLMNIDVSFDLYDPVLISVAVDEKVIFWDLHSVVQQPLTYIPSFGVIEACYVSDCKKPSPQARLQSDLANQYWPEISRLVEMYGAATVLTSCGRLFFNSIAYGKRTDFVGFFLEMVPEIVLEKYLTTANFDNAQGSESCAKSCRETSFLELSMVKNDQHSVRVIIECWIKLLDSVDNNSIYSAQKKHISQFLEKRELLALANQFPLEFNELLRKLSLQPSHPDLLRSCVCANVEAHETLVQGCPASYVDKFWYNYFDAASNLSNSSNSLVPISSFIIPLKSAADPDLLRAYTSLCDVTGSVEVFNTEIVATSIEHAWRSFGKGAMYREGLVHCIFLVLFGITSASLSNNIPAPVLGGFDDLQFSALFNYFLSCVLPIGSLLWSVYSVGIEFKCYHCHLSIGRFAIENVWNTLNILAHVTAIFGITRRLMIADDHDFTAVCFLSVSALLFWVRCLYFLRSYESTGPFVSMIIHIAYDVRYFFLVLFIVIAGFAHSFWLLFSSEDEEREEFASPLIAMWTLFQISMGNQRYHYSRTIALVLLSVFNIVMIVLLMNILIAIMSG
jgi:WD40 repeat protein